LVHYYSRVARVQVPRVEFIASAEPVAAPAD
jgi:hypothetical protein